MQTIYNTLGRQKQTLTTLEPGKIRMYVCGPTVYDFFHIGNARTFTAFDMVFRWLTTIGYQVNFVRNITDIDDKIIERAIANNEAMETLTTRMTAAYFEDVDRLKLLRPTHSPRATHHIDHMLAIIKQLEDKGMAYRGTNGDVYYAVREFANYGKLSGKNPDELRAGERVAIDSGKRDPIDRRVELFFFDTAFGIVPAPPGANSGPSSKWSAMRRFVGMQVLPLPKMPPRAVTSQSPVDSSNDEPSVLVGLATTRRPKRSEDVTPFTGLSRLSGPPRIRTTISPRCRRPSSAACGCPRRSRSTRSASASRSGCRWRRTHRPSAPSPPVPSAVRSRLRTCTSSAPPLPAGPTDSPTRRTCAIRRPQVQTRSLVVLP